MSDVRYFTVTQERKVKVEATNIIDAAVIADNIFHDRNILSGELTGRVLTAVTVTDMIIREDY